MMQQRQQQQQKQQQQKKKQQKQQQQKQEQQKQEQNQQPKVPWNSINDSIRNAPTPSQTSSLSASSVLASAFIPASERQIHLLPILPVNLIEASKIPTLDPIIKLLNRTLVLPSPCICTHDDHLTTTRVSTNHEDSLWEEPIIQKFVPDFKLALQPTKTSPNSVSIGNNKLNHHPLSSLSSSEEEEDTIEYYFKKISTTFVS